MKPDEQVSKTALACQSPKFTISGRRRRLAGRSGNTPFLRACRSQPVRSWPVSGLACECRYLACGAGSQTIQVAKRVDLLAVYRAVVADLTDAEIQSMGPKSTNALSSLRASIASGLRSNLLSGRGARQLSSDKLHSCLFVATNDLIEANQSQCFHFS